VEFRGRFFTLPLVRPVCRPVQKPHPPIWVAANHDAAIERAARLGYCWLINPHATIPMVRDQMALYKRTLAEHGNPVPADMPMMRELSVHQDRDQAIAQARPYLQSKYLAYAGWGQDRVLPGEESFRVPFDELARDRFLIGDPREIVAELHRYEETLGANYMIFRLQWPGMPQRQALRQIELMGQKVIPHFRP